MVNDERPVEGTEDVEDLVEVTKVVDRVVVHVDDDDPDSSVPVVLPVPDCIGETLEPIESVDDTLEDVHEDETELVGGDKVISDSEAVWDTEEPVVEGVIVRVSTPGEPWPLVLHDVELLAPVPELVEEVPDSVTVKMLGSDGVAVVDDPGTV